MYYTKEMTGDKITIDDLSIGILNVDTSIPSIPVLPKKKRNLDSIPVRVKTKYNIRGGRRIVSAPTFDLVQPKNDLSFFKQPKITSLDFEVLNASNKDQRRSLPPLPKRAATIIKRLSTNHKPSESITDSYVKIIQMYDRNSHNDTKFDFSIATDHLTLLDPGLPTIVNSLSDAEAKSELSTASEVCHSEYSSPSVISTASEDESSNVSDAGFSKYSISSASIQEKEQVQIKPIQNSNVKMTFYKSMVDQVLDSSKSTHELSDSSVFSKEIDDAASSIYSMEDKSEEIEADNESSECSFTDVVKMISNLGIDNEKSLPPLPPKTIERKLRRKPNFKNFRISSAPTMILTN